MPRVSVIVPNFNHARYLPERVASILGQTFRDFDLLLMDDASTDASATVIGQIAATDARIRPLLNPTNSGSGYRQWNRGVTETTGEYVWIAESDDAADPALLQTLVEILDTHPDVGISYCQSERIDAAGASLGTMLEWTSDLATDRWKHDFVASGPDEVRRYLCRKNTIPNASAAVFRRRAWERAGGAPDGLRLCADWLLWARMLAASDLAFVARPLNRFRQDTGSVTHTHKKDGTIAEESYRVARLIEAEVGIAPEALEAVRATLFHVWTHPLATGEAHISFARTQRIYRAARTFDPALHRRLVQFAARTLLSRGTRARATSP